jgi:hypothetical protein
MSVSALAAAETGGEYNDPTTTNVHIHPLPAGISEQDLGDLLAKYGDVGTVKIMWPREEAFAGGPKQTKTAGMGGFVAMMERRPAEKAYKDLDGFEWHGALLRTTWGKAVPLPYKALYRARTPLLVLQLTLFDSRFSTGSIDVPPVSIPVSSRPTQRSPSSHIQTLPPRLFLFALALPQDRPSPARLARAGHEGGGALPGGHERQDPLAREQV